MRKSFLMVGALLAIPVAANAQDIYMRAWTTCSGGALRSCHSVTLATQAMHNETGRIGTAVAVLAHNLQGQHPADNMAWSSLYQLNMYRPWMFNTNEAGSTGLPWLIGGATGTPTAWNWATMTSNTTWGRLMFNGGTTGRIGGCAVGVGNVMWTCPGDVLFSITTGTIFDATEMTELALLWNGPAGLDRCTTDNLRDPTRPLCDPQYTRVTDTVTPEPFSIALLGTGLFGVGGAFMRRRNKKQDEV